MNGSKDLHFSTILSEFTRRSQQIIESFVERLQIVYQERPIILVGEDRQQIR